MTDGHLQVGFALADRGLRHLEGRLRLSDLFDDFAVFDLGEDLVPSHAVAQLHRDAFEAATGLRRDVNGLVGDQVTDHRQVGG